MTKFDKVIPPGSEGKIFASVDTSHSEGAVQKFVDIRSNDPANPIVKVSIKAVIKSLVNVKPEYLRFNVMKGQLESQDVTLTPQPSLKLLKPVVDSPLITAELVPEKSGRQRLTVSLKETDIIGTHSTEVKIPVQGPIKEITVPVVIVVRGPLAVIPQIVSFQVNSFPEIVSAIKAVELRQEPSVISAVTQKVGAGDQFQVVSESEGWYQVIPLSKQTSKKGSTKTVPSPYGEIGWVQTSSAKAVKASEFPEPQHVQIQSAAGKPFQVLNMKSTLPAVKIEQKNNAPAASMFEFTVSLQKVEGHKKQNIQGEIVIQTDNADQPQIKIPLYVIFT